MRAAKFVIPIMMIIAWASWVMLNRNHTDVPPNTRALITVGAVILSGVISYFLFPKEEDDKKD